MKVRENKLGQLYNTYKAAQSRKCEFDCVINSEETYLKQFILDEDQKSIKKTLIFCKEHFGRCEECHTIIFGNSRMCSSECIDEHFRKETVDAEENMLRLAEIEEGV